MAGSTSYYLIEPVCTSQFGKNLKFTYKKWRPEGRHVNDGYAATTGRLSGKCKPLLRMALDADQFLLKYQLDPTGTSPRLINDPPAIRPI